MLLSNYLQTLSALRYTEAHYVGSSTNNIVISYTLSGRGGCRYPTIAGWCSPSCLNGQLQTRHHVNHQTAELRHSKRMTRAPSQVLQCCVAVCSWTLSVRGFAALCAVMKSMYRPFGILRDIYQAKNRRTTAWVIARTL